MIPSEPELRLESVDAGHVEIEKHAIGCSRRDRRKKLFSRREDLDLVSEGSDEPAEGAPHGLVVVDDGDQAPDGTLHVRTLDNSPGWRDGTLVLPDPIPGDAEAPCEVHELGKRGGSHLFHDPASMHLHGFLGDPEIAGDLLVEPSRDDAFEDLALPRGEGCE